MTVVSATAWIRMTACFRFGCCTFSWVCLVRPIFSSCRRVVCLLILGLCAVNKSHSPLCCKPPQAKFSMQWVLVRYNKVEWGRGGGARLRKYIQSKKGDSICSACSKEIGCNWTKETYWSTHCKATRENGVQPLVSPLPRSSDCNRGLVAFREDSWFKSLFVRKVDPRKDAHSHLLAKKEDNNLYKIQCWYRSQLFVPVLQCYTGTVTVYTFHKGTDVCCPSSTFSKAKFNGVFFFSFYLYRSSSQCQARVPWCLQWTLVRFACLKKP